MGLFIVLVIIGCSAAWSTSIFGKAPDELRVELDKAAKDGMPLTPDDIRRQIAIPDSNNAAPLLSSAFSGLEKWQSRKDGRALNRDVKKLAASDRMSAQVAESARPVVRSVSKELELVDEAGWKSGVDFSHAWQLGPGMRFPEFMDAAIASDLLLLRAQVQWADGDKRWALASVESAARLSRLMSQEPVIIGFFVRSSSEAKVLRMIQAMLQVDSRNPMVLHGSRAAIEDLGPPPSIRRLIGTGLVNGLTAFKLIENGNGLSFWTSPDGTNNVIKAAQFKPVRDVYRLRFVHVMRTLYENLGDGPGSVATTRSAFLAAQSELTNGDWTYGLAQLIAPIITNAGDVSGACLAQRNVALSAIDILEARNRTGVFPRAPQTSAPNWIDPFTGTQLKYKTTPRGFLVYSVGPDLKDDGGKPKPKSGSSTEYDIPFKFDAG